MLIVTVEIIKCDEPQAWYANLIGESFRCYVGSHDYILKEDYDRGFAYPWCHIDFYDAQIRDVELCVQPSNGDGTSEPANNIAEDRSKAFFDEIYSWVMCNTHASDLELLDFERFLRDIQTKQGTPTPPVTPLAADACPISPLNCKREEREKMSPDDDKELKEKESCRWTYDEELEYYATECGYGYVPDPYTTTLPSGDFCQFCGKKRSLVEKNVL